MSGPVLTPRLARQNHWRIIGHCERCKITKEMHVETLFRRFPDRDLGEALARGKITCTKCERPCSSLDVKRQGGGETAVMKLAPGLTVTRFEADD